MIHRARRSRPRAAAWVLAVLAQGACTDRELVSVDPTQPPGEAAETREVFLRSAELADSAWFDTSFVGFARASSAPFLLAAQGSSVRSRSLLRFRFIASRVVIRDTTREARAFLDGRFIVRLDSARSSIPTGGVLSLHDVERPFDARTADWTFAVDSPGARIPWSVPGGVLGAAIAADTFGPNAFRDTVLANGDTVIGALVLPLGSATDSLLRAWGDTLSPHPGLVLAVEATGDVRLGFSIPSLDYRVQPDVEPDTLVRLSSGPAERTFIFDPPLPDVGRQLAVAGLPAARSYFEIRLPDSLEVDGERQALRGATINRAEMWLTSRPLPEPFAARDSFIVRTFAVVDDVRRFGPKTPLGSEVTEGLRRLVPSSLPDGARFEIAVTSLVRSWASTDVDSVAGPIRFVLRSEPEALEIGRWTFAGAGEPGGPILRIVFTPRTEFRLP